MLTTLGILAASLLFLALGAELLVRGSASIAKRLGVSSFFIGLTIVGFGTSTPELFTSVLASLRDQNDIAVGNVIGSNIFNIAIILGLSALISPIPVRIGLVRREVIIVIVTAAVPYLVLVTGGSLGRTQGSLLLAALLVYVARGYVLGRREGARSSAAERELEHELGLDRARGNLVLDILLIGLGLAALIGGSILLVDSATTLARRLGISELVIGLTIVAAGTSTPEMFTSIVAALRKQSDIAVGNVLGSNIFNILGILGASTLVSDQQIGPQVLRLDAPFMVLLSLALLPIMTSQGRISRVEGLFLVAAYGGYVLVLWSSHNGARWTWW